MKMIVMIADEARLDRIREDLAELGAPGYTAFAVVEGAGRTGLHTGSRVHPGGLAGLLIVESDERGNGLFDELARRRDAAGDRISRLFLLPVERGT
jgi:nitrogen regulatory protein PII